MILLFTAGGRTGNQLFQLAYAISNRKRREWLLTFGFGKTLSLLAGPWKRKSLNLDNLAVRRLAERFLYPVLFHGFVKTGLVSSHYEKRMGVDFRKGRITQLTVMKGYFESSFRLAPDLGCFFRLKESLRAKVRPVLDIVPRGCVPVFVHIRRSDVMYLPADQENPKRMLPAQYYQEAVRAFRKRHRESFFLVVGDDPDFAEGLFRNLLSKWVSRLSVPEDLALMSLCSGGVLSNSTFAWWGAFFGRGAFGYTAPKYWSGWLIKEWHPSEIRADFMTELIEL
jgi:Glycosyl transferase family 11